MSEGKRKAPETVKEDAREKVLRSGHRSLGESKSKTPHLI